MESFAGQLLVSPLGVGKKRVPAIDNRVTLL